MAVRKNPNPAAVSDKPPRVSVNLDTLEREGAPDPFCFVHGGHPYVTIDAMEIDWQELAAGLENAYTLLKVILTPEESRRLLASKMPTWKIRRLTEEYRQHYGLVLPGE